MRLNVKAAAITLGLLWGMAMLIVGTADLLWPGYGRPMLEMMATLYPGYHATGGFRQVIVGALYGAMDGAAGGAVLAWVYNRCLPSATAS